MSINERDTFHQNGDRVPVRSVLALATAEQSSAYMESTTSLDHRNDSPPVSVNAPSRTSVTIRGGELFSRIGYSSSFAFIKENYYRLSAD
ncbi:hypothetical protein ALC62_08913 [Cyphomyrmex costatus]|uniref:Uncharacterized protein n=1 Tax=Cyphomyrmex costatus TaxID=456900 RepID=A0A151IGD5_9HYME|nr:hypothetical protein ALC62_08913 [Cyphomyrmex costatus]